MNDESKSRFIPELWKFIGQRWTEIYFVSTKMATKGVFVSSVMDCECKSKNNMHFGLNLNLWESNSPFHFSSSSLAISLNSRLWKQMRCYLFPSFVGIRFVFRSPSRNVYNKNKNMMNSMNAHENVFFSFLFVFVFNTPLFQLLRKGITLAAQQHY